MNFKVYPNLYPYEINNEAPFMFLNIEYIIIVHHYGDKLDVKGN